MNQEIQEPLALSPSFFDAMSIFHEAIAAVGRELRKAIDGEGATGEMEWGTQIDLFSDRMDSEIKALWANLGGSSDSRAIREIRMAIADKVGVANEKILKELETAERLKQWLEGTALPRDLREEYKWLAPCEEELSKKVTDMIARGLVSSTRQPLSEQELAKRINFIAESGEANETMTTGRIMLLLYAYELSARKERGTASKNLQRMSEDELKQEIINIWKTFCKNDFDGNRYLGLLRLLNDGIWILPGSTELIGIANGFYRKNKKSMPPEEMMRIGRDGKELSQMVYKYNPPPRSERGGWSH